MEPMFAIIKSGGKQYKVKAGDELLVERLETGKSKALKLENVLLVSDGTKTEVGRPFIKGAYCEAEFIEEKKGPKVISFKYIRREKSATKIGHRQKYSKLKIKTIHKGA